MARTARAKTPALVQSFVPQNRDEAMRQLERIGNLQRELQRREADLGDALARIKGASEAASAPIHDSVKQLTAGLQAWCDANRATLTDNGRVKHADLGTGVVRWQLVRAKVRGIPKDTEAFLARLRELGLLQFIRTKEEVNKEAMLDAPEVAETITGIKVKGEGEEFVAEPFQAELTGAAA